MENLNLTNFSITTSKINLPIKPILTFKNHPTFSNPTIQVHNLKMQSTVKTLHEKNIRLRNEIQNLKSSLRELNSSSRASQFSSAITPKSPILSKSKKENLIQNLKQQIENIQSSKPSKSRSPKPLQESKWKNLPPTGKIYSSSNNSERFSMRTSKAAQENIKKIEKLNESYKNNENSHKRLVDSFQSYYESEEENLEKFGKCQFSYIEYKKEHEQGARRRDRKMQEEIEKLRQENSELKLKLAKVFDRNHVVREKSAKSVTPRRRSTSRTSNKTEKSFRTCRSFNSFRRKHCVKCTALLAKGFSTSHCNKHKNKIQAGGNVKG